MSTNGYVPTKNLPWCANVFSELLGQNCEGEMGVQRIYDRLVKQWGRELANEIMLKRSSRIPFAKRGKKTGASRRWSPVVPGSFENGKRR